MEEKCKHEKVYADYVLTSNPPQYPWICKICGESGTDYGKILKSDYEEIKKLFNK